MNFKAYLHGANATAICLLQLIGCMRCSFIVIITPCGLLHLIIYKLSVVIKESQLQSYLVVDREFPSRGANSYLLFCKLKKKTRKGRSSLAPP